MRKSKFTPEQILQTLRHAEGGTAVADLTLDESILRDALGKMVRPGIAGLGADGVSTGAHRRTPPPSEVSRGV